MLWIRNDLFQIRIRILLSIFLNYLKKTYNQSKRKIYQLSAFLYFTLYNPTVLLVKPRIHRPKIINITLIYLLFYSLSGTNNSGFGEKLRIRPGPDPQHC